MRWEAKEGTRRGRVLLGYGPAQQVQQTQQLQRKPTHRPSLTPFQHKQSADQQLHSTSALFVEETYHDGSPTIRFYSGLGDCAAAPLQWLRRDLRCSQLRREGVACSGVWRGFQLVG